MLFGGSDSKKLEWSELSFLRDLNFFQSKKSPSYEKKYGLRQLTDIEILLRENNLEKTLILDLLKAIRRSEKYKEYNITLEEFNKILREKHVADNIERLIYEDIKIFRDELLKLKEYILKEIEQNYEEWIKNENQTLRNLDTLFRKIINEDELIKKYFEDIKDLRYDKRLMSGTRILSKLVSGIMFKIKVEGAENIPKNGPAILAPYHLHKSLDPVILKAVVNRNLHFLVWSEYFFSWYYSKDLVHKLGGLAVYKDPKIYKPRKLDTYRGLQYGKEQASTTFKHSIKLLKYGECLVLFLEGFAKIKQTSSEDENVRVPQSGFVYLQAFIKRNFNINIPVIPIGLKYVNEKHTNIIIRIGNPINVPSELISGTWKSLDNNLIKDYTVFVMDKIIELSR